MRLLGIDYGTKRVGLALSDESGTFALPLVVLENSNNLVAEIHKVVHGNNVTQVVLGESKNFKGENNKVMGNILRLKSNLETDLRMPVILEPEFMTSQHAERFQGKNELHDASAAALILQSYLDKAKNAR